MKRAVFWLTLLASVAACETSTNPLDGIFGGGGGLTAAEASGNWTFTLERTSLFPCASGLANSQSIVAHLDVLSDGALSTNSSWQNPISGVVEPLSGSVGLDAGTLDLVFAAGSSAMELFPGTMTSTGTVSSATITDPAAGFSSPVFPPDPCQYTATATKTG
ncbi:MAG: hypothetical protein ACRENK_17035 [Gemmatimonadaceae bacterium]